MAAGPGQCSLLGVPLHEPDDRSGAKGGAEVYPDHHAARAAATAAKVLLPERTVGARQYPRRGPAACWSCRRRRAIITLY